MALFSVLIALSRAISNKSPIVKFTLYIAESEEACALKESLNQ